MFTSCEKENLDGPPITEEEEVPIEVAECDLEVIIAEQPPGSGQLFTSVTGGTGPFTYLWSDTDSTAMISVFTDGAYSVTVTDMAGCTAEAEIQILLEDLCENFYTSIQEDPPGTLNADPTNGAPPYTYLWSTNSTTESIVITQTGAYSITVTDANGCVAATDTFVDICYSLVTEIEPVTGGLIANTSGGTAPYSYLWMSTDPNITGTGQIIEFDLLDSIIWVTVTDANGCVTDDIFYRSDFCQGFNVTIENPQGNTLITSFTGGTAPVTYSWSTGQTTSSITTPGSGTYSVTLVDNYGCIAIDEIEI